jgi:hypothetical protein
MGLFVGRSHWTAGDSCRGPSDHARGDSPSETDGCRTIRTVRTVVPPVWLMVLADLRETLGALRHLALASDSPWAQRSMGLEGYSGWALRMRRVATSLAKLAYGRMPRTRPNTRGRLVARRQADGWTTMAAWRRWPQTRRNRREEGCGRAPLRSGQRNAGCNPWGNLRTRVKCASKHYMTSSEPSENQVGDDATVTSSE